jgi:hypothetical protein
LLPITKHEQQHDSGKHSGKHGDGDSVTCRNLCGQAIAGDDSRIGTGRNERQPPHGSWVRGGWRARGGMSGATTRVAPEASVPESPIYEAGVPSQ